MAGNLNREREENHMAAGDGQIAKDRALEQGMMIAEVSMAIGAIDRILKGTKDEVKQSITDERLAARSIIACAATFAVGIAASAQHVCATIWGDILTVRCGRASWRNQISRVDGIGIVFPKRDAAHGADAQHRGIDLLNVALQSRKVRRLGEAHPAPGFVRADGSCRWPNHP